MWFASFFVWKPGYACAGHQWRTPIIFILISFLNAWYSKCKKITKWRFET